jgi:hypothetical protein
MSGSERQRRYLERLLAKASQPPGELDRARARIAELEKALAIADTTQDKSAIASLTKSEAKLKSENAELKRLLDGAREHIKKLEARRERPRPEPKAKPIRTQSEIEQELRQTINKLRAQLRYIARSPLGTVFVKSGYRRKILSALHPDGVETPAAKRRHEIGFQLINELFESGKLREIEEDER